MWGRDASMPHKLSEWMYLRIPPQILDASMPHKLSNWISEYRHRHCKSRTHAQLNLSLPSSANRGHILISESRKTISWTLFSSVFLLFFHFSSQKFERYKPSVWSATLLKGTVQGEFRPPFFSAIRTYLTNVSKYFRFWLRFRQVFRFLGSKKT